MSWMSNLAEKLRPGQDDYYDEDEYEEDYEEVERPARKNAQKQSKISPFSKRNQNDSALVANEVCTICPKNMEEVREVTEKLLDGVSVILNTEACTPELATRALDFSCGSIYALNGTFGKISVSSVNAPCGIYLFTPEAVAITGDVNMESEG